MSLSAGKGHGSPWRRGHSKETGFRKVLPELRMRGCVRSEVGQEVSSSRVEAAGSLRQVKLRGVRGVGGAHNGGLISLFRGLHFIRSFMWNLRAGLSRKWKDLIFCGHRRGCV